MTVVEKLIVQIFERKKEIIEQARQQKELYNQYLASRLIINGITPPSWLWNPSSYSHSSDPTELNKEELISELLFPPRRPTVPYYSGHCSTYNKPVVTEDNRELSDVLFMQTHVFDKGPDTGDGSTAVPECRDNDIGCALNSLPELDVSAMSPKHQTDVRISNIYTAPDKSLARIQRSKSRQKALKLRNASTEAKSSLRHDDSAVFSLSGIALSSMDSQRADNVDGSLKLAKTSDINRESCVSREAKEGEQGEENGSRTYYGRIARSRSACNQPNRVNGSLKLDRSSEIGKKYGCTQAQSAENSLQNSNPINWLLEVVNPFDVPTESCVAREATRRKCQDKEKGSKIYCGRTTRSRSSTQQPSSINESAKLDASSHPAKEDNDMLAQSIGKLMQQLDYANELPEAIKSVGELVGRKTRSQTACSNEGILKPVNSSSIGGSRVTRSRSGAMKKSLRASSLNRLEGCACKDSSGSQVISPCLDADVVVNQDGHAETVVPTELVSEGLVEDWPLCSRSNLDGVNSRVGLEGLALRLPSNDHMVVKPKQLDFYDMEEYNLNNLFSPSFEKKRLDNLSEEICCTALEPASSLDKVTSDNPNNIFLEKQTLLGQQVSSEVEGAWKRPFESNVEDFVESEKKKFKSNINENAMLQNIEDNIEAVEKSTVLHEVDYAISDVHKSFDVEMHQVKYPLTEVCPSSLELRVEEGELGYEGRDRRETIPYVFKHKHLGSSFVSSLTKQATGCPQDCLDMEAGMADPTDIILDARKLHYGEDNEILLLHQNTFRCGDTTYLVCTDRLPGESNSDLGEDGVSKYGSVGAPRGEDNNLAFLKFRELQLVKKSSLPEKRFGSAKVDSWPQFKRRKVEDKLTKCFSVSPSFGVEKLRSIHGNPTSRYLKSVEKKSDSVIKFQEFPLSHEGDVSLSSVNKSVDVGTYQKLKCHLADGIESSPRLHIEECGLVSEERNKGAETPSTFKQEQYVTSLVSSLTKQADGASQVFLVEGVGTADSTSNVRDARNWCDGQDHQQLLHLQNNVNLANADDLACTERTVRERKSRLKEDGLLLHGSVGCLHNDLDLIGSDRTLPVSEGFILDAQIENGGSGIARDGIDIGKLDFPNTGTERASILEPIYRSASMHPPLSYLSSTSKPYKTRDLSLSVPNGRLERVNLRSTLLNDDAGKHLRASYSCVDDFNSVFLRLSYSDCLPDAGPRLGWNAKNPDTPPVRKIRERISTNSGSNPELTCFPIDEDPSIIEENKNTDEVADKKIQEGIDSIMMNSCGEREPLAEITEACLNPPASVSAAGKFPDRGSLDSVNTEGNFPGTPTRVKQKPRNNYSNKRSTNAAKENQTLSVGASGIKKANESLHNRFIRPKLSGKMSLRKGGQRLSEKESKRDNIVSNITSFVPLVQQKQAAAVCTGKRDIKVKALEAAEAAKRLEEKRENERKMKKEALKLERARIEQENLRQRVLNKKKNEEEQKKKDADIAARKRAREEDEKKEKERKRKRIEEARRPQKVQEKKLCAGKVVKENRYGNTDGKVNSGKESDNESRKIQKMETESRDDNILKMPETELRTAENLTSDVRQAIIILEDCDYFSDCIDSGKATSVLDKSAENCDLVRNSSQEKSYEISSYPCPDDEEDLPSKKFIPLWASQICVALVLASQQTIDPHVVFPRESFCSMDEGFLLWSNACVFSLSKCNNGSTQGVYPHQNLINIVEKYEDDHFLGVRLLKLFNSNLLEKVISSCHMRTMPLLPTDIL